jgi:hypothetical protein
MAFEMLAPITRLLCNVTQQLSSSIKNTQDYVASSENKVAQSIPAQSDIQFEYSSVSALQASKFDITNDNNMDDSQQSYYRITVKKPLMNRILILLRRVVRTKTNFMRLP